jgi:hypothetical protein
MNATNIKDLSEISFKRRSLPPALQVSWPIRGCWEQIEQLDWFIDILLQVIIILGIAWSQIEEVRAISP